ncbi:TlpA family protein disulfide reductase [Propionicicella superfundia]|uniref:TlpA family protein disulfide reductase n=1 Tax=Propionicicella superfundia TaxID=348582 RepID=UPI00040AD7E5|nr:TlpA disulfide reductase family protein [Propionicicella superfundia]
MTRRHDRRGIVATVLAVLVLLATACAPEGVAGRSVTRTPTPTTDLLALRTRLGIPACPSSDPSVEARADGLPDVTLDCIGGDSQVRLAGLRGRPMLVNVWAQWCEPCRQEAPYLAEFAETAPADLLVLGVDYDDPQPAEALSFAADATWTWAHVVDADRELAGPLQIAGPPQTFFVTADGVVAHRHVGAFTSTAELAALVNRYLGVG